MPESSGGARRRYPTRDSARHEYTLLAGELSALAEDIAAVRTALEHTHDPLRLRRDPDSPQPPLDGETVVLADGSQIVVRPLRPDDVAELERAFERLSAVSRFRRFRARVDRLDRDDLYELTHPDHRTYEVLAALDPRDHEGVGLARYVRDPTDPGVAKVDYVAADAWHHRGVATALVERLAARARENGIERFEATMLAGDQAARRLLEHVAEPEDERADGGVVTVRGPLRAT